jgi:hypothetical protein
MVKNGQRKTDMIDKESLDAFRAATEAVDEYPEGSFEYQGVVYSLASIDRIDWIDQRGKTRSTQDENKSYSNFIKARSWTVVLSDGRELTFKPKELTGSSQEQILDYAFPG